MTRDELVYRVKTSIKGLSNYFDDIDYELAVDDAQRDTSFTLPASTSFRIKWLMERTKRHLFFMLYSESAHKFKVKQFSLNQRFDHYNTLIKQLDEKFEKALEEEMFEFAGVEATQAFGHQLAPGFAYDRTTGKDITYEESNRVKINPSDTE